MFKMIYETLNLIVEVNLWLDGLSRIILAPETCSFGEASTYIFHLGSFLMMLTSRSLGWWLNTATKSAKACPLIIVPSLNSRSYCMGLIDHLSSYPEVLGFCRTFLSG